jgi:hypothetical protein
MRIWQESLQKTCKLGLFRKKSLKKHDILGCVGLKLIKTIHT